jgi:hypothetical protein
VHGSSPRRKIRNPAARQGTGLYRKPMNYLTKQGPNQ